MSTLSLLRFSPLHPSFKTLKPRRPSFCNSNPQQICKKPFKITKISSSYNPTPSIDRIISTLSYTLPFLNTLPYGRFLYAQFPPLLSAVSPFFPLLNLLHSVPFASFVAFFGLYLGVVRNPNLSKYVRFNAMQAVVLDVLLAIPSLLQRVVGVPTGGVGMKVLEVGYGGVFCFGIMCWIYGVVSCVLGKTPYLPIVATAADRQL